MRLPIIVVLTVLVSQTGMAQPESAGPRADDPILCGPPPDRDPTTLQARAKEHFERAEELYELGEYDAAIPEYRIAYCLVPAPEPIYNIAQAYERLVDYEAAVIWFERYILELSPQAIRERDTIAHRLKVLKKLPARIRVATDPPGADIVLEPEGPEGEGEPVRGKANSDVMRVRAGRYLMRVSLSGHEDASEPLMVHIGQPYTFSYRLSPLTGKVRLTTDPSDARIFLDRKLVGVGTFVDNLVIGQHKVEVESVGHVAQAREIEVRAAETTMLHVPLAAVPKNGRGELLVATTVLGISVGTIGAEVSHADAPVLFWLGGGLVGYGGVHLAAPEQIPVGQTSLIIGGIAWGTVLGMGVTTSLDLDADITASVTVTSGLAGGVAAAILAPRLNLSGGDAALVNSGGLWGTTSATLIWAVFDGGDEPLGPILLAGLGSGLLAGATLARRYEFSRGHVALIDLGGLAGAIAGTALSDAFAKVDEPSERSEDRVLHFALGGMAAGLAAGAFLTRHFDEPRKLPQPIVTSARAANGHAVMVYGIGGDW